MQGGLCEEVRPFNFYSLEEFDYQQLISRSKYFVGSYINRETKINFVVKEVPYHERTLSVLRKLEAVKEKNGLAALLGVSLLRSRTGWAAGRLKEEGREREEGRESVSLLLFMQRYEMNLQEYVLTRRREMKPFNKEEIMSFVKEMLELLERLQRKGLAHRDIKPENILYNKGKYLLCDFDDMIEVGRAGCTAELTTVEYSSPEFLRHVRQPKQKVFDPWKLDVYALGLSLLFVCSLGRFSLQQRSNYIYESSQRSHADFMREQRRKWIHNCSECRSFNFLLKMMLEEDEYKRDDFVTLLIKSRHPETEDRLLECGLSDDNSGKSRSSAKVKRARRKKMKENPKLLRQECRNYCLLSFLLILLFILLCLF